MKVWITRYALTDGIRESDDAKDIGDKYVRVGSHAIYKLGSDAYETREAAVVRAEAMRTAKIASLKKQIRKLEAMEF